MMLAALLIAVSGLVAQQLDPGLDKALAAHRAGRMDEAVREYRAFLKLKPQSLEAHSNLGAALAAQGSFADAITEYKAALKLAPSNPGISFNLALAYYKSGELPSAAGELSGLRALIGDEPEPRIVLLLADTWLQMGENDRVIRLLSPAAERAPQDLGVAYVLGTALMRANKL